MVIDSIYRLGFDPRDIKYIINTHWHGDHTEATAAFADLSGAKTLLGRDDIEKAKPYFTPDIIVDDGDTLSLGNNYQQRKRWTVIFIKISFCFITDISFVLFISFTV